MMCRGADLAEILFCLLRSLRIIHCQIIEAYDRVHRRPYLMAHVGEESALGEVSLLRIDKSIAESLTLRKSPSRLGVHIGKTRPDMVDVIVDSPVRACDARESDDLVGLSSVTFDHVCIGNDSLSGQPLSDGFRLYESEKVLPVLFGYILIGISSNRFQIRKLLPDLKAVTYV